MADSPWWNNSHVNALHKQNKDGQLDTTLDSIGALSSIEAPSSDGDIEEDAPDREMSIKSELREGSNDTEWQSWQQRSVTSRESALEVAMLSSVSALSSTSSGSCVHGIDAQLSKAEMSEIDNKLDLMEALTHITSARELEQWRAQWAG